MGIEKKIYKDLGHNNINIKEGIEKKIYKEININKGIEKMATENTELATIKNNLHIINMDNKFTTFKLGYNTKDPFNAHSEWAKVKRNLWQQRSFTELQESDINHGLPCGKVNGFWVLDIDNYKDIEKCQFTKNFGDIATYVKKNNIFTVKTTSGGWHLYFAYNDWYATNIKQTQNAEHNLDIRNDGGYIVAPGSVVNGKPYTIYNMGVIKKCPGDLTIFLKNTLYNKGKVKKPRNKIIKVKNPITEEIEEAPQDFIDLGVYKFGFSDYLVKKIVNNMPKEFYTEYGNFIKLTTALKTLDKKEIWQEMANKHVDKKHLQPQSSWHIVDGGMWDGIVDHNKLFMVNHILLNTKIKNARCMLDYYKYKPLPNDNNYKPNKIVDSKKLGYNFFTENQGNCIVKSDTGTGKTTSFKHLVENKQPFISIVSRVSLGVEQVRVFKEHGISVYWHEDITQEIKEGHGFWGMYEGDNIVITVDSLIKLSNWDRFKNYTIYLDEFNSLVEHLITSPTLQKTRVAVYNQLLFMLNNCNRFIGTDADINDISLRYLEGNDLKFNYIINEYKHNTGIEAHEVFSFNKFIKAVNKESEGNNKWLICCDSKTQSEVIAHINASTDYLLITSDGWLDSKTNKFIKGYKSLDAHDRIIYSPAVLYGLDSVINRPVFCYYKGHTIDPVKMIQQICRCRNITYVKYLFTQKKWQPYKYHDYKEIEEEITEYQQYGYKLFNIDGTDYLTERQKIYLELLAKYKYRADCYDTNKFAHFINIMRSRGFKLPLVFTQTGVAGSSDALKEVKEIKEEDLKNMDKAYLLDSVKEDLEEEIDPIDYYPPSFVKTNEILNIPWGQLHHYKDMFLCPFALTQHLTIVDYFNKEETQIKEKLQAKDDYIINLTTCNESKLLTIKKFKALCQDTITQQLDGTNITLTKSLEEKTAQTFLKEYNLVFRNRATKPPDFTELKTCQQYLVKMYKMCFGTDIIKNKKSTKDGKSNTTYLFNQELLTQHGEIYAYRKKQEDYDNYDYTSSDEEENPLDA